MKKFIVLLVVLFANHGSYAEGTNLESKEFKQKLSNLLTTGLKKEKYVGLSVIVLDREGRELIGHFGHRDLENHIPPNSNTLYEIGSVSKTFARLALANQFKIKLSDPVSKYLPAKVRVPKPEGEDILIRDLVTHTGIKFSVPCTIREPNPSKLICFGIDLDEELTDPYKNTSQENNYKFLTEFSHTIEEFPQYFTRPGTFYSYSNIGLGLLGEFLGDQDNATFEDVLQSSVLAPLKMNNTKIEMPCDLTNTCENLANVYSKDTVASDWKQASVWHLPGLSAAGGIRSSINDMKKFLIANLHPERTPIESAINLSQSILEDATKLHNSNICEEDEQPHVDLCNPAPKDIHYAWESVSPDTVLYHGGATGASQAMMMFSTNRSLGVVVLSNSKVGKGEQTLYHYPDDVALCVFQLLGKPVVPVDFCARL